MNEIDETVFVKIPGYEELYFMNKETNQVYSVRRKRYLQSWLNSNGYYRVGLSKDKNMKHFYLHRLVFLVHQGYLPELIDHIDGNQTNNSIDNLRKVTRSQNKMNSKIPCNNTSGFKGISKHKNGWASDIMYNGERDQKTFKEKSDAIEYNKIMRESLHGEYKREN